MPSPILIGGKSGFEGATFENLLQDCYSCGLITVDHAGNITSLNPEAERVLQLEPAPPSAASLKSLPLPLTTLIREVFQTGKPAANRKVTLESPKSLTTLSVTAMPVSGEFGFSVVAMLNDNSVTARLEHNLRRLDRLARVGTFSASLAHEVKNALTSVKTFVDLLLEKNPDAELGDLVGHEIKRMDGLITHMLRFAAPPAPVVGQVRVHALLELSLHMIQSRLAAKLISLKKNYSAHNDLVPGDDAQLEQAILNLVLNALDAMGEEGCLTISTVETREEGGRQLWIHITDTGGGISAANLSRIFDPFFTTKPRGTGLGLCVTRRIIEEHKGDIRVETEPGKGTTFTIRLPADMPV